MTTTDTLRNVLDRLEGVKGIADSGKWTAFCPAHERPSQGHTPSLSITQSDSGAVLLCCHAGCTIEQICGTLDMPVSALFPPKTDPVPRAKRQTSRRIVATYDYTDETDRVLFQIVRYDPKDFGARRPDGKGGWTWNLNGVKRVLYRLLQLKTADPAAWVFVAGGEKDADGLVSLGLTATTNPGGEGHWSKLADDSALHGRRVCIIVDKDAVGRAHGRDVAQRLLGKAADVRILELPDVNGAPVKDSSDWIGARDGQTTEELAAALLAMADEAPTWTPPAAAEITTAPDTDLTEGDVRLGREFAAAFADRVRYCPDSESWLCWDSRRWAKDAIHEVEHRMQDFTRDRLAAAIALPDRKARESQIAFWVHAMRRTRIEAALWAARSDPRLIARLAALDADPWSLNTLNGTLNLKTRHLRRHDPADFITKLAPVEYRPDADQSEWLHFLSRVLPDAAMREFLARAVGYTLTGLPTEEVLFFVCGPTAGGKSTFVSSVGATLGDYAATANFATFLAQRNKTGPRPDIVRLAGRRFVTSIETEESAQLAGGLLKWITGQDRVCERSLYTVEIEFLPTFTLWLVSNFRPKAQDDDSALWRRLMLLPFDQTIPETERDPNVKMRLRDPTIGGPAVLAWAVEGCRQWQQGGLQPPQAVKVATRQWRSENDPIIDWLGERATLNPLASTAFASLNRDYHQWAEENGLRPISGKKLAERLQDHGCRKGTGAGHARTYEGIGLK